MLYVTETFGPLPPAEQPMAIPPILCKCPCLFWNKREMRSIQRPLKEHKDHKGDFQDEDQFSEKLLQKPTVSPYEPLHLWPLWIFPQQMSAGRARRDICIVVIMSSACDQAQSGCAWLMHLHAHVQSMMSWRLCCFLQSIVIPSIRI